jgi:hypothetical protein
MKGGVTMTDATIETAKASKARKWKWSKNAKLKLYQRRAKALRKAAKAGTHGFNYCPNCGTKLS